MGELRWRWPTEEHGYTGTDRAEYVESFATDVPDAPDFEVELSMLRAEGTGQALVGEAQSAPHFGLSWPCDGDGD